MQNNKMKISIFGLGYVGCVGLGCLAQMGHEVIGVDVNSQKVDLINNGFSTIIEKDIDKIIFEQSHLGRIKATTDYFDAVVNSDISMICVGSPSSESGHLNLDYVYLCATQIGEVLKIKKKYHIIVVRSTVLPGTNQKIGEIISDVSGLKTNRDFSIVSNPEFLREGSAVEDFYNPSITVLGSENSFALDIIEKMYKNINSVFIRVDVNVAEIIKYVNNSFHALKIAFANEIGNICKKMNIDSHEVMRVFVMDNKLNISKCYLKPGFAYGGSCLPKDLKALNTIAHDYYLEVPVLNSIEKSNVFQKNLALKTIIDKQKNNIGFIGLSFKSGTDDLRYSPSVDIIEQLLGKGKKVLIFDKNIKLSRLICANKSYLEKKLPHISSLLVDNVDDLIGNSDVIIIPNGLENNELLIVPENKIIIDFFGVKHLRKHKNYNGLSW